MCKILKTLKIVKIFVVSFIFQVIDFGSSCYEHQRVYTYIQSRFYRAPEVILGARYGMPIDMWSLGCILAELFTGYPLLPGEDEADQLSCIIELLGMPPQKLLDQSKRAKNFINSKGECLTRNNQISDQKMRQLMYFQKISKKCHEFFLDEKSHIKLLLF